MDDFQLEEQDSKRFGHLSLVADASKIQSSIMDQSNTYIQSSNIDSSLVESSMLSMD
jgi:hypothetical protein